MSTNDEFILAPPSMLNNAAGPDSSRFKSRGINNLDEFRILLPDHTLHSFRLPKHALGIDCIDKICDVLGIVEKEYFGLYFIDSDSGYKIWINKRLQIRKQIKQKPPFEVHFAVKFYTQSNYLLQPQTIEAYFLDLRHQIKRGDIHVPNSKKAIIGARIAQAELGDLTEPQGMLYSPYFPNWNSGIAHIIRKEHKKLKGNGKKQAQLQFIQSVYDLENYGMQYVRALVNDENVIIGIGAKYIRIFSLNWRCKTRIPFAALTQVAFGSKFFSFQHLMRDSDRNTVERKITCYVYNHTLARSLFRMVTEDQVFHYQPTVSPVVRNHADNRESVWRMFCRKVLKMKYPKRYYYDIERTKKEAFRNNWQLLNQVASDTGAIPDEPPAISLHIPNQQIDSEEEDENDPEKLKKKAEIWWGLSDSSTNLAKELLPSDFITLSPSQDLSFGEVPAPTDLTTPTPAPPSPAAAATSELLNEIGVLDTERLITKQDSNLSFVSMDESKPLSKAQGRKMYKFLMKIQDEKVCNVCMDELISSVFCPCGHYVACARCARKLDKCPVCREPIGYVQFVYTKSS